MKLLVVISTLEFGDAQSVAVGLAEETASNNIDVTFLVFYGDNPYKQQLEQKGIDIINLNYKGGFGFASFFSLRKFQKEILKNIENINPDLIHSNLFLSKLMFFGAKGKIKIPIIDTHHDNSPWWIKDSIKSKIKVYIESYFFKYITSQTVSTSKSVYDELLQFTDIPEEKLTNIDLFNNCDFQHGMSQSSHEKAVAMFDKKNAYKQYEKLYTELTQPYYIKNMNTYQYF